MFHIALNKRPYFSFSTKYSENNQFIVHFVFCQRPQILIRKSDQHVNHHMLQRNMRYIEKCKKTDKIAWKYLDLGDLPGNQLRLSLGL